MVTGGLGPSGLRYVAFVEQLEEGNWLVVVCAACCYMALIFAI